MKQTLAQEIGEFIAIKEMETHADRVVIPLELLEDWKLKAEELDSKDISKKGLPAFLYVDNYFNTIKIGFRGDSAVTDEWNEYINR